MAGAHVDPVLDEQPVDQVWEVWGEEIFVPQFPVFVESSAASVDHEGQNVVVTFVAVCRRLSKRRKVWTSVADVWRNAVVEPDVRGARHDVVHFGEVVEQAVD